jgi:hypothetical protein
MSDRDPRNSAPEPLEYWHGRAPISSGVLGMALVGGLLTSLVAVFFFGGMCSFATMDSARTQPNQRIVGWVLAGTWFVCFMVGFFELSKYLKNHRDLSLEVRRQPGRFFVIGLFIGFGLAALFQGICFGFGAALQ